MVKQAVLHRTEIFEDAAELFHGDYVLGVHAVSALSLSLGDIREYRLQALDIKVRDCSFLDGCSWWNLEPITECIDERVPRNSGLGEEVSLPELASAHVADRCLNDDVIERDDDLAEGWSARGVFVPAPLDEAAE